MFLVIGKIRHLDIWWPWHSELRPSFAAAQARTPAAYMSTYSPAAARLQAAGGQSILSWWFRTIPLSFASSSSPSSHHFTWDLTFAKVDRPILSAYFLQHHHLDFSLPCHFLVSVDGETWLPLMSSSSPSFFLTKISPAYQEVLAEFSEIVIVGFSPCPNKQDVRRATTWSHMDCPSPRWHGVWIRKSMLMSRSSSRRRSHRHHEAKQPTSFIFRKSLDVFERTVWQSQVHFLATRRSSSFDIAFRLASGCCPVTWRLSLPFHVHSQD